MFVWPGEGGDCCAPQGGEQQGSRSSSPRESHLCVPSLGRVMLKMVTEEFSPWDLDRKEQKIVFFLLMDLLK